MENFANMMNEKAKSLELENTHFITPHGLDETEHYTTAFELAKITDYALKNKKFSQIVNTKTATININGAPKTINNTNELLGNLNGVDGVKTGFTNNAGRCLVTSISRNGHRIICVVLGADTKKIRTSDSIKLIEYAFANYEYVNIKEKIEYEFSKWKERNLSNIDIIKGKILVPQLVIEEMEYDEIPINKNEINSLEIEIKCKNELVAPLEKGEQIGVIEVRVRDEVVFSTCIVLKEKIEKKGLFYFLKQLVGNYNRYLEEGFCN